MEGKRNRSKIIKTKNLNHLQTDLPEDIIVDVLLRLPVKSLLKFKCVSKPWLSLISSPQFVKAHLNFSTTRADFTNHGIMLTFFRQSSKIKQCLMSSLMSKGPTDVDYPYKSPHMDALIVGSCNGIICFVLPGDEDDVLLWNPSTRKFKTLPPIDVETRPQWDYMWGFGYVESEDDYKVVSICGSTVKIYSSKTDSWKRIGDLSSDIPYTLTGRFVGGKLHFPATSTTIVSLDLKTEAYGTVEQPDYWEDFTILGTIGGCLSIVCDSERREMVEVWVMKEYGVKESWTRIFNIPYSIDLDLYLDTFLDSNTVLLPNGEYLLLVSSTCLTVYNPKDNCFRHLISNLEDVEDVEIYVESLVSL